MVVPFEQINIFNITIRIFYKKDPFLYTWHRDDEDRKILFFSIGKWYIQKNNKLPYKINFIKRTFIKRGLYHRLIRNKGFLIAFIVKNNKMK